jgi:hypothetical protein
MEQPREDLGDAIAEPVTPTPDEEGHDRLEHQGEPLTEEEVEPGTTGPAPEEESDEADNAESES